MHRNFKNRGMTNVLLAGGVVGLVAVTGILTPAVGWERYTEGCDNCHGGFRDAVSPKGSLFPGGDKHDMHRQAGAMGTDCNLCHGGLGTDFIASSDGTANNPGVGCLGCHGQDYGGEIGYSGVGLRAHHINAGAFDCSTCHPNDPVPMSEATIPVYYGTVDTNCDDPCNIGPGFLENWTLNNPEGLDNDGDLLYDEFDPDCGTGCLEDLADPPGVEQQDLNAVLNRWGDPECLPGGLFFPCAEDLAAPDGVEQQDLNAVLNRWGDPTCLPGDSGRGKKRR